MTTASPATRPEDRARSSRHAGRRGATLAVRPWPGCSPAPLTLGSRRCWPAPLAWASRSGASRRRSRPSAGPSSTGRRRGSRTSPSATFGTNDKLALLVGTVARARAGVRAIGVLAAVARRGARRVRRGRRRRCGRGAQPAGRRPGSTSCRRSSAPPPACGSSARCSRLRADERARRRVRPGRRWLVGGAVGRRGGMTPAALLGRRLGGGRAPSRRRAPTCTAAHGHDARPIPAGADLERAGHDAVHRAERRLLPHRHRPRRAAASTPRTGSCRVNGMVDREVELDWDTLLVQADAGGAGHPDLRLQRGRRRPRRQRRLAGWPVRELLAMAGPQAPAPTWCCSTSIDGFTAGTPLGALTDDRNALLAIGMNGEPLPFEHGFPVRMVVPGLYGYVSATKWVDRAQGDDVRRRRGVLDAARLVGDGADQDRVADRRARQAGPASRRAPSPSPAWRGRSTAASQGRGAGRRAGRGSQARLAAEREHRHLAAVGLRVGRTPGNHTLRCAPPTAPARCRPAAWPARAGRRQRLAQRDRHGELSPATPRCPRGAVTVGATRH